KTRATGAEEELTLRRKARITARDAENEGKGRYRRYSADVGRGQRGVERLVAQPCADEELAEIGRRRDLELMALGKILARCAIGIDDALGQQVQHLLVPAFWYVGGEQVIEAAVLADDDDDVLDRACGLERMNCVTRQILRFRRDAEAEGRQSHNGNTSSHRR